MVGRGDSGGFLRLHTEPGRLQEVIPSGRAEAVLDAWKEDFQRRKENVDEAAILGELDTLLAGWAAGRDGDEAFGDWLVRAGKVAPVTEGREIHEIRPGAAA